MITVLLAVTMLCGRFDCVQVSASVRHALSPDACGSAFRASACEGPTTFARARTDPVPAESERLKRSARPAARTGIERSASRDEWLGPDKLRHFLTAFAVTGYAHAGLRALDVDRDAATAGAVGIALAASVGKELYDVRAGRFFSARDLVWDVIGIGLGVALVRAAR